MNVDELWQEYNKTKSDVWRNKLVEHYMPAVHKIAWGIYQQIGGQMELDDLRSLGILGLISAVRLYDSTKGLRFNTYCAYRIRGAIIDGLREADWVPRGVRKRKDVPGVISLDQEVHCHTTNDTMCLSDFVKDSKSPDPVTELSKKDVFKFLGNITEREKLMLRMRYFQEKPWDEVSKAMGLSEAGAHLVHRRLMHSLKAQMTLKG